MALSEIDNPGKFFSLSGRSRYPVGAEYTESLLAEMVGKDGEESKAVLNRAKVLHSSGLVSKGVVVSIKNFLNWSGNDKNRM